jgi:hypothetical protein
VADPGAAGNWTPTTWNDFMDSPVMLTANLTANKFIFRTPWPPQFPDNQATLPRFYRLAFVPAGTFTAGTIACAVPTMGRPDQSNKFQGSNFTVA